MFKDVFQSILGAAQKLFRNWGACLISFLLYAALVGVLYLFFTIRESSMLEVVLTFVVLPVVAITLFFVLQAMAISYMRVGVGAVYLLKRALKDCWLLLLMSLPLVLAGWLLAHFVGNLDPKWATLNLGARFGQVKPFALAGFLLLFLVLPLLAIHWWIAAAREGLGTAFKGIARNSGRALAPRSILIYLLVVAGFGALAYLLFFLKIHPKSDWGELWFFGARFALGLVMIFLGWMITLGAMAEMTTRRALGESEP